MKYLKLLIIGSLISEFLVLNLFAEVTIKQEQKIMESFEKTREYYNNVSGFSSLDRTLYENEKMGF
ncbi:MAG: hypothetical protein HY920_06510 [Elusimicrobia bacterium]|nr:hypothetical protein [Elusimicrobiota bacterium]